MEPGPPLCASRAQTSHLAAEGAGTVLAAGRRTTKRALCRDMCHRPQAGAGQLRPCVIQLPQRAFMRTRRRARAEGRANCPPSFRTERTETSAAIPSAGVAALTCQPGPGEQRKDPPPLQRQPSRPAASRGAAEVRGRGRILGDTHLPLAGICCSAKPPGRTYAPPLAQSSLPDVPPRAATRTTCHAGG